MYVLFLDLGRLIRSVLQLDNAREVSGDCVAYTECFFVCFKQMRLG